MMISLPPLLCIDARQMKALAFLHAMIDFQKSSSLQRICWLPPSPFHSMPAPLVLQGLGFVVSAAVGGIIEGKADDRFRGVQRILRERLPALLDQPEGLDLIRGMRRAQFRALDRLVRDFQEVGPHPPLANLSSPDPFFERALAFCADSLRSISTYIPHPTDASTAGATQLASLMLAPADNVAEAVEHVEDAVLAELRAALDGVPLQSAFEPHFRNGGRGRRRYVEVFGVYVAEEIKEDEAFREVLNAHLHLQTLAAVQDAAELAERILREFGPALSRIEDNVGTLVQTTDAIRATQSVHDAKLDQILRLVSVEKGIPIAPLQKILERLGELNVSPENITERLDAWAGEYVDLRAKWSQVAETTPDVAAVKAQALALIEAADFDGARHLFAEARDKIRAARQDRSREEAALLAAEAEVDRLELRYRDAAERYAEAETLVCIFDPAAAFLYQWARANTLQQFGEEFGDNVALLDCISGWRKLLDASARATDPHRWAKTQNNLGNALVKMGERESGTARLEEAVVAFRAALDVWTRDREPLDWATTQNNLGIALARLGGREGGTTRLEEAATAFRAALSQRMRHLRPLVWATTQNNLGNVLRMLGERESGTARLEEALSAFRAALEVSTRKRAPLDWAMTQNNLGNALQTLGQREYGTARLEEAVAAYRAALVERTRTRVPLAWAGTQNNLGAVLQAVGERENGTARLEEAIVAYRAALEERTRDRVPRHWAFTQNNMGSALRVLGERESGTASLEEAVAAFQAALQELTREQDPLAWAMIQNNLGIALKAQGERESGTARLEEAVATYRAALEERTRERVPLDWAMTQNVLGNALQILGERESGTARLRDAVAAYTAALEFFVPNGPDHYTLGAQQSLEVTQGLIAERRAS